MIFGQIDLGAAAETEAAKFPYRCDAEVHFCNRNGATATVRLRVVPADGAVGNEQYLWYGFTIAAGRTSTWPTSRYEKSERVMVYSDLANVSVNVFGKQVSQ